MRVSFVILHYNVFNMTILSVECLLAVLQKADIDVVIVDNASPNGSGNDLQTYFKDYQKVHVLLSERNLGFAQGNNMGYRWAKEHLNPDYIVVMNNDVLITDSRFIEKINQLYNKSSFAVLGPDIYSPYADKHQNPVYGDTDHLCGISLKKAKNMLWHMKFLEMLWPFSIFVRKAKRIMLSLFSGAHTIVQEDYKHDQQDVVLHGACYIFSPVFIKEMEQSFLPDTFMFLEEDILHLTCRKKSLKMLYDPSVSVIHLEDIATNSTQSGRLSKIRWKNKEVMKSMKIFISELQK